MTWLFRAASAQLLGEKNLTFAILTKTHFSMRLMLPLVASLLCLPAAAQSDAPHNQPVNHKEGVATTGNVGQVKVEDDNDPFTPNAFVGSFRMEMHNFKNGVEDKDGPMNMHYWSSPDMTLIGMADISAKAGSGTEMKVLTDLKGKWTYMLMKDPRGNKTAMKSRKKKVTFTDDRNEQENGKFTVTDETKMIDGHLCKKVVGTTDDGTWTGWVAQDIAVPFTDIANSMTASSMRKKRQNWQGLQGFPLEFETMDKNGKDKTVVYVKDLQVGKVDPGVFSISDYKVMEIPGVSGR